LLAYDGKNWQDLTPLLKGSEVWSLQGDKLGRVWVGTGGAGLIGIQGKSIRRYNNDPTHAKSCIYATAETSNGDLYVGTQYGLWRLRGETWEDLILNEEQRMQAIQVVVDPQDRVWVLDPNYGIFVYQRNAFTLLSSSALLKGKGVQTLRRTPEGNMEADTINRSRIPAVKATYRWLPDTPLLQPELINK
jgi:ligand-binding sensor domain-containing protein